MNPEIKIPYNAAQADCLIDEIAELQKKEQDLIRAANEKIVLIRDRAGKRAVSIRTKIELHVWEIFNYYLENKKALTVEGRLKIIKLLKGSFREYFTPNSVRIIGDEKEAIKELEASGFSKLVRIIKEVDKEAVLRHRKKIAKVKSIKIVGGKKKFSVTPDETGVPAYIDIKSK
jgi:phage host-nuclease inhibitor protein Gam